jgi:hypothetical protein
MILLLSLPVLFTIVLVVVSIKKKEGNVWEQYLNNDKTHWRIKK